MSSLAIDQLKAVEELKSFWSSSKKFHILGGAAGTGKTYVIDKVIESLPRVKPILLSPTHKALRQLKSKGSTDYPYRTVASALGIRPIADTKELKFEQISLPPIWDIVNLAVADEASMLDDYHLDLLDSIDIKIIFLGHKSQLPPVKLRRSIHDKCISPVFDKGYGESTLYIPKRNTGSLWTFCNTLEQKIYDDSVAICADYDIDPSSLRVYMDEGSTRDSLLKGKLKIALWTNEGVERYNTRVRQLLWGAKAGTWVPGDLAIVTSSCIALDGLEAMNDRTLIDVSRHGLDLYTDTDGIVQSVKEVTVRLNKTLVFQCYRIRMYSEIEGEFTLHSLVYKGDYKRIADYYEHKAWSFSSKQAKDKAYNERATILKCFAQVKHFYASTCHRLQGSTVDNILLVSSDVNKNSNKVERAKCAYVGASRASKELMIYRGLI
jgi:hypothetical protein